MYLTILGAVFLGWSLGANDAANVFGTAVASRMVRYRTAVVLICVFVAVGAILQGGPGIRRVGGLTAERTLWTALLTCTTAALAVTLMTALKLPVSATQALAGATIGMGLFIAPAMVQWGSLGRMVICWVGTPIGAAILARILYPALGWMLEAMHLGLIARSIMLHAGLIVAGSYGAYALGASNVGNVTGVFYGIEPFGKNVHLLAAIGAFSIMLGVVTYSRNVMFTVGARLVELDAFSALVAVLAGSMAVHGYAMLGVPVSTSQAIVGGVLGIGLCKGVRTILGRVLRNILLGWVLTPLIAAGVCFAAAWALA